MKRTRLDTHKPVTLPVRTEADVYAAVGLGRVMAGKMGFEHIDQIRLETIIVKLAFTLLQRGSEGEITLRPVERNGLPGGKVRAGLEVTVSERKSADTDLAQVLAQGCVMSACISSVRQLADEFVIDQASGAGRQMRAYKWGGISEPGMLATTGG